MAVALVHSLCRVYIFCPGSLGTLQVAWPLGHANRPYALQAFHTSSFVFNEVSRSNNYPDFQP
ncbi:hypothetical protein EmuJ_000869900 [Echinococcus multilocularis]|uniref:Uncharacterized protein n=1 Tax=Echinococcus multilocularis TaxID=6211 RepID=A0A068YCS2_ECHMU|nr:hypothetical protein EmuJ_000869900 [Echinococcus multilocularis]